MLGENSFIAGCILLSGCLLGAMLAPISGRLLDRFGAKRPIVLGCLLVLTAMLLFYNLLSAATAITLALIYMVFPLGQAFSSGNIMVHGLNQLPQQYKADGNAIFNTMQQLAGAIGTAVIATIVSAPQAYMPDSLPQATALGSQHACLLLCSLALLLLSTMYMATTAKTVTKDMDCELNATN
ncbi:hypothetical protein SELR_pSRC200690 (plasmid) [Selenomonas ruminantium subsp. lactilytica TAM6421]|uniref:Major facilitator superfamily (MFS) profile domain-containing protein n=1 Tax=Selenomonas ruminantium subsp. lactilytica (strain NBRC 103574 / TAM6421) TaxID=927704 RepID=I0GV16_SELRL|nr:hypothetical protein SELR_pSRC200690 [Selenomonas ruminantium subsp. lactilytica TAM6421]